MTKSPKPENKLDNKPAKKPVKDRYDLNPDRATGKKNKAIALLLTGMSPKEVASKVGASLPSVYNWSSDSKVKEYKYAIEQVAVDTAKKELVSFAEEAVRTMHEIMTNSEISPDVRLKAAKEVLDRIGVSPKVQHEVSGKIETKNENVMTIQWVLPVNGRIPTGLPGGGVKVIENKPVSILEADISEEDNDE